MVLSSLPVRALTLLGSAWLAHCANVDVALNFYTDIDCKTASTITPSASLNLSTCIVTPGLVSLHFATVPCAGGGSVSPYLFSDTSCGEKQDILQWYKTGSDFHCFSDFASDSVAAIMLSCNKDNPEKPVATSTVSVGPVATGAAAPTSSAKGSSSSEDGNSSDDHKTGWNSLSMGARIGIIVAAAVVGFIIASSFLLRVLGCSCHHPPRRPDSREDPDPRPPYPPHPPYDPASKTPSMSTSPVSTAAAYLQVLDNVKRSAREHVMGGQFDTGTNLNALPNYQAAVAPNVLSAAFAKQDPDWRRKEGAAGELYVFEYLQGLGLPSFGRRNWTSSVRTRVNVHAQYRDLGPSSDGVADIVYYDDSGAFTSFLIDRGFESQGIRRGSRPKYEFEVKTTCSPNWRKEFYMSDNQEAHIRDVLITPGQTDTVYIICRIFNLGRGSKTGMNIYVDPEALRRQGRLHFSKGTIEDPTKWTVTPV